MAYVLPGESDCWINNPACLTNETLLSLLNKWGLFSWEDTWLSSEQHTRHAGRSCLEACAYMDFFLGDAAQRAPQVSRVAGGTAETSCKQVFWGVMKPSGKQFWKWSCPVLLCSPGIPASGYWVFSAFATQGLSSSLVLLRTVSTQTAEASPTLWGAVPGAAATISP